MTTQQARQPWRQRLKTSDQLSARFIRAIYYRALYGQVPQISWLHSGLWHGHHIVRSGARWVGQTFYFTPLFKSRLISPPRQLHLYSGMPQVLGSLDLRLGERCRVSGVSSFFGRAQADGNAQCNIGENVDIGWQNTIAVGKRVVLEDNVRLASRCYLAGFPGHPEDPIDRATGLPETPEQTGDIILKKNVWLASGVTVLAGVTIGENSIIGAGSVVTRDIPANVVAAGVPAKVLRPIKISKPKGEQVSV